MSHSWRTVCLLASRIVTFDLTDEKFLCIVVQANVEINIKLHPARNAKETHSKPCDG